MTIIAWDGKMLAADKRSVCVGLISTTTKIRRMPDGELIGCSGDMDAAAAMMKWYEDGADPASFPANMDVNGSFRANMIVIRRDGTVTKYERSPYPMVFEDKQAAMGSGRDYAMAAMYCGLNAKQAVEVASHFDNGCGNGVDVLTLDTD